MQGTFVLPMTLAKNWNWENIWLLFSLVGMVFLNLFLAYLFIADLYQVYREIDPGQLLILAIFGLGWGLGAVLFGLGMDKLGMSLGYPIIMGLIASIGGLLPMFIQHTGDILKPTGMFMMAGVAVSIAGIIVCSKAAAGKSDKLEKTVITPVLAQGIIIAIAAGILSSLPNIGFSFGTAVTREAMALGTPEAMAGNAVWALFFSAGFIPNLLYTAYLIRKNRSAGLFMTQHTARNFLLGVLMAVLWIASFYLYGISSSKLGNWGNIVGWPMFISVSIIVGNLWGLWRGEWKYSSRQSRQLLNLGILILMIAMVLIGLSNVV